MFASARATVVDAAHGAHALVVDAVGGSDTRAALVVNGAIVLALAIGCALAVRNALAGITDIGLGALKVVFFVLVALVLGNWALFAYAHFFANNEHASATLASARTAVAEQAPNAWSALTRWWHPSAANK